MEVALKLAVLTSKKTDATKLTNVRIARFRQCKYLIQKN